MKNIEIMTWIITGASLLVGIVVGMVLRQKIAGSRVAGARRDAEQIVEDSRKEAEAIRKEAVLQAKDAVLQAKSE